MNTPFKAIVFDFFGVISSEVAPVWLNRHARNTDPAAIKEDVVGRADRGSTSLNEMFLELSRITTIPAAQIQSDFYTLVTINQEIIELIKRLQQSFKIGLLTNASAPFLRTVLRDKNLEKYFDAVVISSEEGCAKPDTKIYEIIIKKLGVPAQEIIFIDDNERNVVAAEQVGMKSLVFTTGSVLHNELQKINLF